jgi:hypothetical protein
MGPAAFLSRSQFAAYTLTLPPSSVIFRSVDNIAPLSHYHIDLLFFSHLFFAIYCNTPMEKVASITSQILFTCMKRAKVKSKLQKYILLYIAGDVIYQSRNARIIARYAKNVL